MGIAVVRRGPNILEELAKSLIPSLIGSAIEDGKRRYYAAAEQGLYQNLYDQISQAPPPAPINFSNQDGGNRWGSVYNTTPENIMSPGAKEASWLNTWDAAHQGTNDPMALAGMALQSEFARKFGGEAAMKVHGQLMGLVDGQKQARIAAANRAGLDSMATRMGSQGYDYRSPHQVMPEWIRYGIYGGDQGEFTDALQHLSPAMQFKETDLGHQKIGSAFDPGTGALNPLFQAAVGVSPNTQYAQDAQTARQREDWALRTAERRADPKYQLMVQAHERYNAGDRTPEVMRALNLAQASPQEEELLSPSQIATQERRWTGGTDPLTGAPLQSSTKQFKSLGVSHEQLLKYMQDYYRNAGGDKVAEQVFRAVISNPYDPYFIPMEERTPHSMPPVSAPPPSSGGMTILPPSSTPTASPSPVPAPLPSSSPALPEARTREEAHISLAKSLLVKGWSPEEILAEASDSPEAYRVIQKFLSGREEAERGSSPLVGSR